MPAAGHPVPQEVEHKAGLEGAHKEVVALDIHLKLGEDHQRLPAANNAQDLQNDHNSEGSPF